MVYCFISLFVGGIRDCWYRLLLQAVSLIESLLYLPRQVQPAIILVQGCIEFVGANDTTNAGVEYAGVVCLLPKLTRLCIFCVVQGS